MKRRLLVYLILGFLVLDFADAKAQVDNTINKVVIDAGHGGKDPGALGKKSKEKNIALSVALKTGKLITDGFGDVEVVYTRDTDVFIELHKRAEIANESGADVFISIHCNSNKSSSPYGAETYVMGLHKTQENLDVAKTENAAIYYEENYKDQYEGFDPDSDEGYIVLSMFQSLNINQSIDLAQKVEAALHDSASRKNRGVKQAGFWVLYKTTMPGVLVELGFLSNPKEEAFLISPKGQDKLASSIFNAFKYYKQDFEEANKDLKPVVEKEPPPEIFYRVQFASFRKEKPLGFRKFKGLKEVKMYRHNGMFKYTVGNAKDRGEATSLKNEMKIKGYKDVFIVAFHKNKRISKEEVERLMSGKKEK
ncbi:MAG: N-acetylmuramoyl-L-alanine amidase [Chlorobi bacterium]|nr:N-acetylmuramoyl-L-alanine amidase [Chlorobiota bacterium]